MSEAEFYRLPDARAEFVSGEVIFMSPVSLPHARLVGWLFTYMDRLARKSRLGEAFLDSVAVRLSPDCSRVPDLSFVVTGGRATVGDNRIDGPPDLIVEVVSPDSRDRDYRDKYLDYQAAGVTEYWIIDPLYQSIDLHRLSGAAYVAVPPAADGSLTSSVLPGLVLRAEWLRQSPLPDPAALG